VHSWKQAVSEGEGESLTESLAREAHEALASGQSSFLESSSSPKPHDGSRWGDHDNDEEVTSAADLKDDIDFESGVLPPEKIHTTRKHSSTLAADFLKSKAGSLQF